MAQVPSNLIPSTVSQLPFAPEASAQGLLLYTLNGVSYKIYAGDLLQVSGVPVTRQVIAGTGLQGGGQLSSNVTLSVAPGGIGTTQLANSGVTPGTYGSGTQVPVLTVDGTGRVTAATTTAVSISGYVPESRQVIAGQGLSGGGPLTSNVTLSANLSSATPQSLNTTGSPGVSNDISRADHKHPAVNLANDDEVDGVLGLGNGGTARSIVPDAGAIVWSGADGLYLGPVGGLGQVLVSGGTGEYVWGSAVTLAPMPANYVFAGPAAGPNALSTFRLLVNADIPSTLTSKSLSLATITNSSVDSTPIGANSASTGAFTTVGATTGNITTVNATTVDTTNVEVTNLKAKDGTAAGSIADVTGVVTLNSAVLTTADINGGTADGVTIGGSVPAVGTFTTANATDVNATTVDTTNLEVTNLKAKDGTAAATIADSTGAVTVSTLLNVDNLRLDGNTLSSTDTNGNVVIDPNGTGVVSVPAPVIDVDYLTFDTAPGVVPATVGTVSWDGGTTLNVQMTTNVLQRVGESEYVYAKASSAITKGQLCYHTGAVGASSVITVAPTPLALADPNQIVGVAAESIALNDFGLIQVSGVLRGFNTTGSSVGEVWADGDPLYYNPAYVGGMTKTKPTAPNQKSYIGEVISAGSGGSGSMHIRIVPGSVLGGTDSNVQFGTLANNNLIQYDSTLQYWKNVTASSVSVGTATNLAGGAAGSVPYQTGAGATTFLSIGTAAQVLKVNAGATAPEWVSGAALSKTDDTNVTLTLGGAPTTSLLAATSLTLGWTGQLAVSRGGTGTATATANTVFAGPTSGGAAAPSFRALVAGDIPSLPYNPTAAPVTQTANFSVGATDVWTINNKSGSSCVVTLPAAASYSGRVLYFQNYQAQTLVSASSNVVPIGGGAAGTSILLASAGDQATLVSNGTNWIMMQYIPNNILLLE